MIASPFLNALRCITFINDEYVPRIRVRENTIEEEGCEDETFVEIDVEIPWQPTAHSIIEHYVVTPFSIYKQLATRRSVALMIEMATDIARRQNYRLSIEVNPEDYPDFPASETTNG